MGLTAELAQEARIRVRQVGGLELIAAGDGELFLEACSRRGVQVLGVEGFSLTEGFTRPDMNAIADFSGVEDSGESIHEALDFINEVAAPGLMLEFTLS